MRLRLLCETSDWPLISVFITDQWCDSPGTTTTSHMAFILSLLLLTQGWPVRSDPLQTLNNYLTVLTERGFRGEVIHITCEAGNKVGSAQTSDTSQPLPVQLSIQAVSIRSQAEEEAREVRGEVRGEVQRLCQGRDQCQLQVTGEMVQTERNYLEVSYQCRPVRFRSRTMCRDDTDSLACPDNTDQGLVILSANFLSVNSNNNYFYCPGLIPSNPSDSSLAECTSSSVSPGIIQLCHSHQNCSIKASPALLGSPACRQLNVFLKVIFACVTRGNIRTVNKDFNSNQTRATAQADLTTISLNTQTRQGPETTTVNKEIVEALIEQEEDNESEAVIETETEITDKKLILSSELKLEPRSDSAAPDRPPDQPDSDRRELNNFQVCKIFNKFNIKYQDQGGGGGEGCVH